MWKSPVPVQVADTVGAATLSPPRFARSQRRLARGSNWRFCESSGIVASRPGGAAPWSLDQIERYRDPVSVSGIKPLALMAE
jgi:hypothetical protein